MNHFTTIKPGQPLAPAEIPALGAQPIPSPAGTSVEWEAAITQMRTAAAASTAHYRSTYQPALDARNERRRQREVEIATIPHFTTGRSFTSLDSRQIHMMMGVPADIQAEYDRLGEARDAAYDAILEFEAASLPDLRAKIAFIKSQGGEIDQDILIADLSRIAGEA
jgi:hypothetical protein